MKTKNKCKHKTIHYYSATNEDGWKCIDCNKKLGFRPDLDKKLIYFKVLGVLDDMVIAKLVYISNGSEADFIRENVVYKCNKEKRYDQYSIIKFIIEDPNINAESHYRFWNQFKSKKDYNKWNNTNFTKIKNLNLAEIEEK